MKKTETLNRLRYRLPGPDCRESFLVAGAFRLFAFTGRSASGIPRSASGTLRFALGTLRSAFGVFRPAACPPGLSPIRPVCSCVPPASPILSSVCLSCSRPAFILLPARLYPASGPPLSCSRFASLLLLICHQHTPLPFSGPWVIGRRRTCRAGRRAESLPGCEWHRVRPARPADRAFRRARGVR